MYSRTLLLLVVTGIAAVATALGIARYEGGKAAPNVVVGSASTRWPVETLRDWTDYADQLSVIRIESEVRMPRSRDVVATGEGMVGRRVTARIEETLWQSPGSPAAEGSISFTTWGWVAKGGVLKPAVDSSSDRLEVGDRVLAPLLQTPEGSWAPLSPSSTIRLVDGETRFADRQRRALPELADTLDGVPSHRVAELLLAVEPRPNAAALRRLDPDARARELAQSS